MQISLLGLIRTCQGKHRDSGTSVAYEARVQASSAEAQKGKTRDALEDQGRSQEAT